MKRKREQEPFFDDENGRCHLLEAVREMRAHICSFLVPDPADLAHLAQTCKVFETQLVREQTGLLYYPWHWRRHLDVTCETHWMVFGRVGDLSRAIRAFLLAKSLLHVFDGLKGGQAQTRLRLTVDRRAQTATFQVGDTCKFIYCSSLHPKREDPLLPTPKEIDTMKERVRTKHAAKLEKARLNRKIPAEVRNERARLKTEQCELRRTLVNMARKMKGYSCAGPHQLPAYIKTSQRFVEAGKRCQQVQARLEEIQSAAQTVEDAEADDIVLID
jgi:hypothetical protein